PQQAATWSTSSSPFFFLSHANESARTGDTPWKLLASANNNNTLKP
ncbi:hypothetical protein A2U01_0097848, partial [Trifolium medium]|nr:hypothetical protein [Trifolium medium]